MFKTCNNELYTKRKIPRFNDENRLGRDVGAIKISETESQLSGYYGLTGYDPNCCQHDVRFYENRLDELMQYQKPYRNSLCDPLNENELLYPNLTNLRVKHQLYHAPYVGSYMGAGQPSLNNKDLETVLFQGVSTNLKDKACQVTRGTTNYRFQYLPEYGLPQRVECVIEEETPTFYHIPRSTRDDIRKINYKKYLENKCNNKIVDVMQLMH